MVMETCVKCSVKITYEEAIQVAEWLLDHCDYTLDEGPYCSMCGRYRRAEGDCDDSQN